MFISKRCRCSSEKCPHLKINTKTLSDNLALLSVKSRLDILFILNDKPHCVCDLITHTKMSQSLISHHLADLSSAGLVKSKREGKFIEHYLTSKGIKFVENLIFMTA